MNKKVTIASMFVAFLSTAGLIGAAVYFNHEIDHLKSKEAATEEALDKIQAAVNEENKRRDLDAELGQHILRLMSVTKSKISDTRKQLVAQAYVRVANNIFTDENHKKQWAVVMGIESRYDSSAKSPAGALGIGQIMPQYAEEFGKPCGLSNISTTDLYDTEINMILSACLFRELLNTYDGNVAAALVAYNAGAASMSMKQIQSLHNIANTETVNYVARFLYASEEANANRLEDVR